jgi:hypothetical protein
VVTPLAAAASVVAVIAASVTLAGQGHTRPGPGPGHGSSTGMASAPAATVAGVPPYYVALTGFSAEPQKAVVRATANGAVLATVTPPRPYGTFTWVSSASDDRTFVLAAQRYWRVRSGAAGAKDETRDGTTPTVFFRLTLDPAGHRTRLTALPHPTVPESEQLGGIALSPDGTKLALALRSTAGQAGSAPASGPALQVVTLATGAARKWTWPGSGWVGNFKPMGQPLSWTADGQTIEFQKWTPDADVAVRLLDTTVPGSDLATSRVVARFRNADGVQTIDPGNTIVTPDGTKIVIPTMRTTYPRATVDLALTEFSTRTGRPVDVLDPWQLRGNGATTWQNVLWSNPSGSTLIVMAPPGKGPGLQRSRHGIGPVAGVLTSQGFTPLPGAPADLQNAVW